MKIILKMLVLRCTENSGLATGGESTVAIAFREVNAMSTVAIAFREVNTRPHHTGREETQA